MSYQGTKRFKRLAVYLLSAAISLLVLFALAGSSDSPSRAKHDVYIAFGFHVNLYHSFRNDTNDESGFGKDIRVIRHIIRVLDRCNADGIPVKGVWDFDNLFSLQEILPQYAPDIIENIRRRVRDNGDEVILMSYNNGLVSAMTPRELDDAVRWSITNPWQSGVRDLFGKYSPVVRPQEMMTTPGTFSVYKKHGIQAVSLYYSATPFDAFRVFSRPLSRAEAHNPILYHNTATNEEMVVIPTYHIGDLVEHVSLRAWVNELRNLQDKGELNHDALIFINYDADSELWHGIDLPWLMEWLPNTNGIGALISEVQGLPNVHFTTVGHYLAKHPPAGTFSFSQDTADGSFDGYNSWAEKADASLNWTVIERSRRVCEAALAAETLFERDADKARRDNLIHFAELTRMRALSTTHFGMATPYVARQREQAMARLMEDLNSYSDAIESLLADRLRSDLARAPAMQDLSDGLLPLDTLLVLQTEPGTRRNRFFKIPQPEGYRQGMALALVGADGVTLPAAHVIDAPSRQGRSPWLRLVFQRPESLPDGIYRVCAAASSGKGIHPSPAADQLFRHAGQIANKQLAIRFEKERIEGIYLDGVRQTDDGSFTPYIRWGGRTYCAQPLVQPEKPAAVGAAALRMSGPFPGPLAQTRFNGWVDYRFILVDELPFIILQGTIRYPTTATADLLNVGAAGLIRRTDLNWQEVAPAEIRFAPEATRNDPVRILKRNYLGVASEYPLDYFRYDDRNLNLDDINNHITAAYVGVVAGNHAMAIAMDNSVQSNFAFAPIRLSHFDQGDTFTASANPFGTYHGRQYAHPTWGNGNGYEVTLLTGEQYASSAPTYNGVEQTFTLMLAFFKGRRMPEPIQRDLIDFADPPLVISATRAPVPPKDIERPRPPMGLVAAYQDGAVQFSWDNSLNPEAHYRILCGLKPGHYDTTYPAVGNHLKVCRYEGDQPFIKGQRYYATIETVTAGDRVSMQAPEIQFTVRGEKEKRPAVPLKLEIQVLWANLYTMLTSWWMS